MLFFFVFLQIQSIFFLMKRIILFFIIVLVSINVSTDVSAKTKQKKRQVTSASNSSLIKQAKTICEQTSSMLPYEIPGNILWTSIKLEGKCIHTEFKLLDGDTFIEKSLEYGAYSFMGTIFESFGLSEREYRRQLGLTVKVDLYNNQNRLLFEKVYKPDDYLAYYNRHKDKANAVPTLDNSIESFQQYAKALNLETPIDQGEGIMLTNVYMSGKNMVFKYSVPAKLALEMNNISSYQISSIKDELAQNMYNQFKRGFQNDISPLNAIESLGIKLCLIWYDELTKTEVLTIIITAEDMRNAS